MKFLGCPYPMIRNPRGFLATQSGIDQIKSDLLVLLLTNPGERCFLPDFGTPLRSLLFEQNDAFIKDQAKNMIIDSIKKWEPRIAVNAVEVSTQIDPESLNSNDTKDNIDHILSIKIVFVDPENIQSVNELKLVLPLEKGI